MSEQLNQQKCVACQAGAPKVTEQELGELIREIPDWSAPVNDGIMMLERDYKFKNFRKAQEFTNKVADLAEAEDHHPAITLEWGKVKVVWWTHKIKGLHRNDFICAAKTDQLFAA